MTCTQSSEERPRGAEYEIRQILDSLFVGRGKLITGAKEWRITDEIGNQKLQPYLAGKLRKLVLDSSVEHSRAGQPDINRYIDNVIYLKISPVILDVDDKWWLVALGYDLPR